MFIRVSFDGGFATAEVLVFLDDEGVDGKNPFM